MCGRAPCGIMLCTWSEEYRRLTEARTVACWSKETREAFYKSVAAKRGKDAARRLFEDVRTIWGAVDAEERLNQVSQSSRRFQDLRTSLAGRS